jgi:UDP-glucose 4-epimerase
VNDTVEALLRLQNTPAAIGQVVNIGSTEEISILDLARRVVALLDSKSEIRFLPYSEAYRPGFEDMPRRKPSIEKLTRLTGFTPATSLDATIESVAHAFRAGS